MPDDLASAVDNALIRAVQASSPRLREAIRSALDNGAHPAEIRKRAGIQAGQTSLTTLAVEAIIAEWEAEKPPTEEKPT